MRKSPFTYERIRYYNQAAGKHEFVITKMLNGKIVRYYFNK
tara:strand:- start:15538 stop:15660 length:123 start_codon:yes stop_codon:yes gene_type:complete